MYPILTTAIAMAAACAVPSAGGSAESQQTNRTGLVAAIARMETAYRPQKLLAASRIRLEEDLRIPYAGHDYSPAFHDLSSQRRHHVLNLRGRSGSSEYLTDIGHTRYHARSILHDGRFRFIDYAPGTYQDDEARDFHAHYGAVVRASDVLLAVALFQAKDGARFAGREMWLGQMHDAITFDQPGSPPLTVLIQDGTGHISKMTRIVGGETAVQYTFDHHDRDHGIAIAREHSVYARREPLYFSFNRRLVVNAREDRSAFQTDKGLKAEPKRLVNDTLSIRPAGKGGHHVGREESFTTFFDTSAGLIAFGLETGFSERLEAYRKQTGVDSPLRVAVAADHHEGDHAGAPDAAAAGAAIWATTAAQARVKERLKDDKKVEAVETRRSFGDIAVLPLSTAHAAEVLIVWQRSSGLIVQSGHYISPYVSAIHYAKYPAVSVHRAILDAGLKPSDLLSTASARTETWASFSKAVAAHDRTACYRSRPICRGWVPR